MDHQLARKPRVLCLHGFRTSGKIFEKQCQAWPECVREMMDFVFIDAPFPAEGGLEELGAEELFDPPLYEWFQANKDFSEFRNFDECIAFVEDCMMKIGPFDGLMGFSQGAFLSAALPGMQAQGMALTTVPKIKFTIMISGGKFGGSHFPSSPKLAQSAFSSPIECPSLHFLGEKDLFLANGIELLDAFVDPVVINHPKGHVVPKLDEKGAETMIKFIEKVQELLKSREEI